jgi:ABC-type transporter Mla MlaB component
VKLGVDVMLRIQRIREKGGTRLLLSGELRCVHLEEVRTEISCVGQPVTLDLQEVGLIDIDGILLLNECRSQGTKVRNCAPYIREWMRQESSERKR